MDNPLDRLGAVIKEARIRAGMTQENLAKKLGISTRHIIQIENGYRKPSYNLLFLIVRELVILTDTIFFPEHDDYHQELEQVIALLYRCNKKELCVVTATLIALLEG